MKRCVTCLLLLLLCCLAVGANQPSRQIAVLVTIGGVSLDQLASYDSSDLHALLRRGSIGLMNNKTDGMRTFEDNAVTIGAGTRALGAELAPPLAHGDETWCGYNALETVGGELAKDVLERNIGITVPDGAVVHTGIGHLLYINSTQRYTVIPGLLGDQLQHGGVTVGVFGNSDQGLVRYRNAVAIAMNKRGWVPFGDVGANTVIYDQHRPFGIRTNYAYLLHCVQALPAGKYFIAIELGDAGRAESARPSLMPGRYDFFKQTATLESYAFVRQLDSYLRKSTDQYLLAAAVIAQNPDAASRGDLLTPVVMTGNGIPTGLLSSKTTRRPGLIINLDLTPTILSFFSIKPDESELGSPIHGVASTNALATLQAGNRQMTATYRARMPMLMGYVAFVAISGLMALGVVLLLSRQRKPEINQTYIGYVQVLLIAVMLVPATLMIAAGFGIHAAEPSTIFLLVTALPISFVLLHWVRDLRLIFTVVGFISAATIAIDLVCGAPLLKTSILSYDPITGIRFYGLGNEASGVLVGSSLLGLYALLEYSKKIRRYLLLVVALIYLPIFVVIGSPTFGSDFGGMFAALAGFGMAMLKARDDRAWRRTMAWVGAAGVALIIAMLAINMGMAPENQTHIGRAFSEAMHDGPSVLFDLALRKWAMNLRLIRSSIWTYALVSLIVSLVILLYRPVGILQATLRKYPLLNAGMMGILIGMIVALLTNDSGIAMAATGLMFMTVPLLLLVINEMKERVYGPPSAERK